jgi:hypothetical protein
MNTAAAQERERLTKALGRLGIYCQASKYGPKSYDDFLEQRSSRSLEERCAWRELWPESRDLGKLDSAVEALDLMEHKKPLLPLWKTYERVNKRWRGIGLVRKVNWFVKCGRERLSETSKTDLMRLTREAVERVVKRQRDVPGSERLFEALEAIRENVLNADGINWQDYEQFLPPSGNKLVQLMRGDSPVLQRVKCYARTLQILVDDLRYQTLRDQVRPFTEWIAHLGNKAYYDLLNWDVPLTWEGDDLVKEKGFRTELRNRELARLRKQKQREREKLPKNLVKKA